MLLLLQLTPSQRRLSAVLLVTPFFRPRVAEKVGLCQGLQLDLEHRLWPFLRAGSMHWMFIHLMRSLSLLEES
jgi:hypothetical protein